MKRLYGWLLVFVFAALIGLLMLDFGLYQRLIITEDLLRISTEVTPGLAKAEVQRRLHATGSPLSSGVDPTRSLDVSVPAAGSVLLFDSYLPTQWSHVIDFVVVFDRRERVTSLTFISNPLSNIIPLGRR